MKKTRAYKSEGRLLAAEETRQRILDAAKRLFAKAGIDRVTIAQIAERSEVAQSTVYSLFGSKAGVLRGLMSKAIFSARYEVAALKLKGVADPVELLRLTASVARAVYENEAQEIGILRGASAFSPALKKLEREFEDARFDLQRERVTLLFEHSLAPDGMTVDTACQIMWMYTSRDVYRMLVVESGWSSEAYEKWLADTLVKALTAHFELPPDGPRGRTAKQHIGP